MPPLTPGNVDARELIASVNEGLYATDLDRRIVYWSPSAERITGWKKEDILGKRCADSVLSHVDKDGRPLCSTETCPLHRSMMTGHGSRVPIIVFAQCSDGRRIPMRVSVAPFRDASGEIVGGVETFREVSDELHDAMLARRIQTAMLGRDMPQDKRMAIGIHYQPMDLVGGDYYASTRLGEDQIAFILADVSGHGVAASLYTVYLDALWRNNVPQHSDPAKLASVMAAKLSEIIGDEPSFATAIFGLIDLHQNTLVWSSAGGPAPLLFRKDGRLEELTGSGLPLGFDASGGKYDRREVQLSKGDCLLAFTDGALEVSEAGGGQLGSEGLVKVLNDVGYPLGGDFPTITEKLLTASDRIRFDDDLTFLEMRIS